MKIIYDNKEHMYLVKVEYPETEIWINTNDIAEVRTEFIKCMTQVFNDTICEQLQDDNVKVSLSIKVCTSEDDHEWEACGISTAGSTYVCKKCYAHKTESCNFTSPYITVTN